MMGGPVQGDYGVKSDNGSEKAAKNISSTGASGRSGIKLTTPGSSKALASALAKAVKAGAPKKKVTGKVETVGMNG